MKTSNIGRDLLAGLAAIMAVVGVSIRAAIVGSDLRFVFGISMIAFFLAGLARGHPDGRVWIRGLIISSPGLLGTAALIVNDGLHRWPIPLTIAIVSIVFTVAGVECRREWMRNRLRSLGWACGAALGAPLIALFFVPGLVRFASVKEQHGAATPFAVRTAAGEIVNSEALRGRVVVLSWWASWCLPCRWELPEIDRAYRRFQRDQRVIFFAVDRGGAEETPARAKRYFEKLRLSIPLAFEESGFAEALAADALPALVIVDQEGHTRLTHHGYDASERLEELVVRTVGQLLAEKSR
jgi:thiol-disulfide isomerase/thioredoxin